MARTRRNAPLISQSQAIWQAALYTRLSREDGDKPESDSIANQRALLEDFTVRQSDLQVVGTVMTASPEQTSTAQIFSG